MAVKEIKELDEKVKEVNVVDAETEEGSWEESDEKPLETEEEEKEDKFSIGDTMLARGKAVDKWGKKTLEEEIYEEDDFEGGFSEDDSEEEEEEFGEAEGFSYETMGQGDGDLYGAGASSSGGDLYGVGGSGSGMDLYGAPGQKGSDSANMYNAAGSVGGESSLYNTGNVGGKKNAMSSVYQVEGGKKKRFNEGGKRKRSELEGYVSKARKKKGVSMI